MFYTEFKKSRYVGVVNAVNKSAKKLSAYELAALACAAVPGLQIRGFRDPFDSPTSGQWVTLIDTDGNPWLIWSPLKPIPERNLKRYMGVLALLEESSKKHAIPFKVSLPAGITARGSDAPVLVFSHPGGSRVTETAFTGKSVFATSLGTALAELHELDVKEYGQATGQQASAQVTQRLLTKLVENHATAIPAKLRSRWLDALRDDALWNFVSVPVHGSLSIEELYVAAGGAVVGIAGFDMAAVGDPAQDVAWLMYYASDDFLDSFEKAYAAKRSATDLHLITRAQLLSELETLRWYVRGVIKQDRTWKEEGLVALRQLAQEIGDHQLVAPKPEVLAIRFELEDEPLLRLQEPRPGTSNDETVPLTSFTAPARVSETQAEDEPVKFDPATSRPRPSLQEPSTET